MFSRAPDRRISHVLVPMNQIHTFMSKDRIHSPFRARDRSSCCPEVGRHFQSGPLSTARIHRSPSWWPLACHLPPAGRTQRPSRGRQTQTAISYDYATASTLRSLHHQKRDGTGSARVLPRVFFDGLGDTLLFFSRTRSYFTDIYGSGNMTRIGNSVGESGDYDVRQAL